MSSASPSRDLSWVSALEDAARVFNGGPRSFPASCDGDIAAYHLYQPPNEDYERLFLRQLRSSQRSSRSSSPHSAGWLLPDELSVCRPVFVAHSLIAAIWLIRQSVGDDALPVSMWQRLVLAAQARAGDASPPYSSLAASPPPSAQKPLGSPSLPLSKRAATSETTLLPVLSKRLRGNTAATPTKAPSSLLQQADLSQNSELAATPQLTAPPIADGLAVITSVTNNNRRAERARAQKRERAQAKQRLGAGLAAPPQEAPQREHSAYKSIEPADEAHVSWLLKQTVDEDVDLFNSVAAPYVLAATMMEKARSVGNSSSRDSAAAFLRDWRAQGTPFGQDVISTAYHVPSLSSALRTYSQPSLVVERPCHALTTNALTAAWTLCERYEQALDVIHIKYRWAMAFLGKTYTDKMEEIRRKENARLAESSRKGRGGKGKVSSEAIDNMLSSVSTAPDAKHRQRFKRRLHQALRWYEAANRLGWGMLCLMPHDIITNSWVENDIRVPHWHIWLGLVSRVNPVAYEASQALEVWLGADGLSGGSISEKEMLYIEETASRGLSRPASTPVTEIADSDDEGLGSDEESEGATALAQIPMRQRTLLELFKPHSAAT